MQCVRLVFLLIHYFCLIRVYDAQKTQKTHYGSLLYRLVIVLYQEIMVLPSEHISVFLLNFIEVFHFKFKTDFPLSTQTLLKLFFMGRTLNECHGSGLGIVCILLIANMCWLFKTNYRFLRGRMSVSVTLK